ncbi:hypothetical protein [Gemmobacter caeruleus]|uniref:hypothetical protein n=1 Tax=Gemmobacter caeruleus TaxID=2595004 RepID=UPI0011EFFC8D|nr:hypothetical protein [Gemmobacter caeruleus]
MELAIIKPTDGMTDCFHDFRVCYVIEQPNEPSISFNKSHPVTVVLRAATATEGASISFQQKQESGEFWRVAEVPSAVDFSGDREIFFSRAGDLFDPLDEYDFTRGGPGVVIEFEIAGGRSIVLVNEVEVPNPVRLNGRDLGNALGRHSEEVVAA